MAQFRGTLQGQRGVVSRLGSKSSGLVCEVNGWHDGIRVEARSVNGHNVFTVYKTAGSNGGRGDEIVYTHDESLHVS